ncbi:MAG TPA: hypothetical protein OIM11_00210 [Coriobacteriaceae bacterium]|nr:hypothetical protein [Coriobacteriaceae bacterium]
MTKGLLIETDWCTGCHACEMACQQEHDMPVGQTGIKVFELGPWEYAPETWQLSYVPIPTDQCDGCATRVSLGKQPSCVQHCQARCISYGNVSELAKDMEGHLDRALYTIR